jgi:Spy/CpxP family protein refolding chaperone
MRRMRVLLSMVAAMMIAATSLSYAQQRPAGGPADASPGQGGNAPTAAQREEVRKKVEAVKIWKLTEALKLDANTSAKLSAFINPLDQQRQEIWREQMMTMRELRSLLQSSKPDEAKLRTALDKLEKNHRAIQEVRNKEFTGVKDILTTEQQARYFIFQQEFRHEMRGMISGARGGGPGKGGMGPGGGQGMRGGRGWQADN